LTHRTWHYRLPQETDIVEIEKNTVPAEQRQSRSQRTCSNPELAQKFIDYLKSDSGKATFQKWGYN